MCAIFLRISIDIVIPSCCKIRPASPHWLKEVSKQSQPTTPHWQRQRMRLERWLTTRPKDWNGQPKLVKMIFAGLILKQLWSLVRILGLLTMRPFLTRSPRNPSTQQQNQRSQIKVEEGQSSQKRRKKERRRRRKKKKKRRLWRKEMKTWQRRTRIRREKRKMV